MTKPKGMVYSEKALGVDKVIKQSGRRPHWKCGCALRAFTYNIRGGL